MLTAILAVAGALLILFAAARIAYVEEWRRRTERRRLGYAERAAQANGHPQTGQVTPLGRYRR